MSKPRMVGVFLAAAALVAGGVTAAGAATGVGTAAAATASVQITSSAPPGDVTGVVRVTAVGRNQSGDPEGQMEWDVDGVKQYAYDCHDPMSCTSTWGLDGAKTPGTHTVQAVYRPKDGQVITSQALTFRMHPDAASANFSYSPTAYGSGKWAVLVSVYYRGSGVAGVPVTITFTPAVGKPSTRSGTTTSDGTTTFIYPFTSNTKITLVSGRTDQFASATRSKTFKYVPEWTCSLAKATVKHGKPDSISCKVPNLPAGTKVQVDYLDKSTWVPLAKGKSGAGKVAVTFTPKTKGKTYVRVESKGAKVVQDSTSPAAKLKVT